MLGAAASALPHSLFEADNPGVVPPEIRAYKLGKKRWSYNQVELVLGDAGGGPRRAIVQQAVHAAIQFAPEQQNSAVGFLVQLRSGQKLQVHIYLCYDRDQAQPAPGSPADTKSPPAPTAPAAAAPAADQPVPASEGASQEGAAEVAFAPMTGEHSWKLVMRQHCHKGCSGPILRSIQRFGRLGKRSWSDAVAPGKGGVPGDMASNSSMKDPRYMYLSLDEACTHVDATAFRLVAGIYNRQGTRLLTTTVSPPIRVLANNDVPTGAARIPLEAQLPADWEGWIVEDAALAADAAGGEPLAASPRNGAAERRRKLQQLRAASGASSQSDTPSLADATKLQASQTPQAQAAAAMATQQPQQPQQQQQPKAAQVPPQLQLASMLQISRAPSAPLPVSAGAPAPPLLQLLQLQQAQQAQQLQQLPQLQQAQQQQALLQRALAPGGADDMSRAAQQLSQLLQLLQTVNDGGAAPLASLGQSLPFLATSTPLQLSLPGAAPSPMAALGSLLAGLPGLATPASIPQPQLSSANLINMLLSGAGATPSPLPAWPTVPVALPNLAAKAGNPGPAPPSSPGPDDAAAWNHALERAALAWVASQGTLSSYAAPAPVKAEGDAALPKQHSGAPPTPRDVPMDAMAVLANLAAAAAST